MEFKGKSKFTTKGAVSVAATIAVAHIANSDTSTKFGVTYVITLLAISIYAINGL